MIIKVINAHNAVASPAPIAPMFMVNTKKKSPNTLITPPASTAAVASPGLPSFRRNAASIWLNTNRGTANLIGSR